MLRSDPPRTRYEWVATHIRGMVLLRKGELDAAIGIFAAGAKDCPFAKQAPYFRTALAVAKLHQKRYEEAVAAIKDERHPVADVLRIHAHGRLGQGDEARAAYERSRSVRRADVVRVRDALASVYIFADHQAPQYDEKWFLEQECELLLRAA